LAGDAQQFAELVRAHQQAVSRFCIRYTGSVDAAADLTQEVFLTFWDGRRAYRDQGKLKAYLLTIARHRCLAYLKKHRKESIGVEDLRRDDDNPERAALAKELRQAIKTLEPPFAEVLILRYLEGFDLNEIAELTASPVGTVKSRLHRALGQLRRDWHD
jgi:RNA polymerase sigma-70 factor, ECF subfamily